jgi:purine nucleoside permease
MRKKLFALMLAFVFTIAMGSTAFAATVQKLPVKVMIISIFEVGEKEGDYPGEYQRLYERYLKGSENIAIKGTMNGVDYKDGILGTLVGMGKASSASTMMAILKDPRFDFSKTYFITSACAGGNPNLVTTGSVCIADKAMDIEYGYRWVNKEDKNGNYQYEPMQSQASNGQLIYNKKLVDWAYNLTKDMVLVNSKEADHFRSLYKQKAAHENPKVVIGSLASADAFTHGTGYAKTATRIVKKYVDGEYTAAEFEDNAIGLVLKRMGYLKRTLTVRSIVNFDRPAKAGSMNATLDEKTGAFYMGIQNGSAVVKKITDNILKNWDKLN